jgi:hypothetical protein
VRAGLATVVPLSLLSLNSWWQLERMVCGVPEVCCVLCFVCSVLCFVCCLLFVVCCVLFVVCCLLFVVFCVLYVVCCVLFVVCCVLCVVCRVSYFDKPSNRLYITLSSYLVSILFCLSLCHMSYVIGGHRPAAARHRVLLLLCLRHTREVLLDGHAVSTPYISHITYDIRLNQALYAYLPPFKPTPLSPLLPPFSEFDNEERAALLKFTWGRTRLPLSAAEFTQRFKIQVGRRSYKYISI